jgi:hypothetical protein
VENERPNALRAIGSQHPSRRRDIAMLEQPRHDERGVSLDIQLCWPTVPEKAVELFRDHSTCIVRGRSRRQRRRATG